MRASAFLFESAREITFEHRRAQSSSLAGGGG